MDYEYGDKRSLVSRGGTIYFPSEIYPEFGIEPFTDVPVVTGAE